MLNGGECEKYGAMKMCDEIGAVGIYMHKYCDYTCNSKYCDNNNNNNNNIKKRLWNMMIVTVPTVLVPFDMYKKG